ncbi:MAG TPA: carbohydrate porin, partial [Alphaproteobacteria bacterium]|nr:carbohydrate porin [Alphaproteobacteria bacterium]
MGDMQSVSNIDSFRDEAMLYELWLEQSLWEGVLALRGGLVAADTEVVVTGPGSVFLNSAFGWPSGISLNTENTGPAFFRPALGGQVRWRPRDGWTVHAGVYDGDTFDGDPEGDSALAFRWGSEDGTFGMLEVAREWDDGEGLERGRVRVGCWGHSLEVPEHGDEGEWGRRAGLYGGVETFVWRDEVRADRALALFGRVAWSPAERSVAEWSGDAGMGLLGLLAERYEDVLGVGVAWVKISEDCRGK